MDRLLDKQTHKTEIKRDQRSENKAFHVRGIKRCTQHNVGTCMHMIIKFEHV